MVASDSACDVDYEIAQTLRQGNSPQNVGRLEC